MSATAAIISGIAGLAAAGISAGASAGASSLARSENYHYNEAAADAADKRTRALYNDLYSPEAQIKQLKNAGLSPSVYYENGGGISGQAGAQGAGISGPVANPFYIDPMMASQIANMNADTRLKNTEADKNEAKNPSGIAEFKLKMAQAGMAEANKNLTEAETYMQQLQNLKFEDTYNAQVQQIVNNSEEAAWNARKAYFSAEQAGLTLEFNQDTYEAKTAEALNNANEAFWRAQVEERKVQLTEEQANSLKQLTYKYGQNILQGWKDLQIKKESVENQKKYWNNQVKIGYKQTENEANKIYFEAVHKTREENNRHEERQDEIDLQSYKMIIQAMALYFGLDAKSGNNTPTQKAESTNKKIDTSDKPKMIPHKKEFWH